MSNKIENFDRVTEKIFYSGFGEQFNKELLQKIDAGETKISLERSKSLDNALMTYALEVGVDASKGKAYFNGFRATRKENNGQERSQWFPAKDRITENEAEQLLRDGKSPRSILKNYIDENDQNVKVWVQLDFSTKTQSGNNMVSRVPEAEFNLGEKLKEYTLGGINNGTLESMEKGNKVEVSTNSINYPTVFIAANSGKATISITDTSGKFLSHDQFRTAEALLHKQEKVKTFLQGSGKVQVPGVERSGHQEGAGPGGESDGNKQNVERMHRQDPRQLVDQPKGNNPKL